MNTNETKIIVKLSLPFVLAVGYAGYKIGEYKTYIKLAKVIVNKETKKDTED